MQDLPKNWLYLRTSCGGDPQQGWSNVEARFMAELMLLFFLNKGRAKARFDNKRNSRKLKTELCNEHFLNEHHVDKEES